MTSRLRLKVAENVLQRSQKGARYASVEIFGFQGLAKLNEKINNLRNGIIASNQD